MRLIAEYLNEDDDFEGFIEDVNAIFQKVFPKGEVGMIAKNHGWRKVDGYRTVEYFKNGCNALAKATVPTASVKVYVDTNGEYGRHIAINTAHHDSPCWDEWTYIVRPKYMGKVA